MMAGWWISARGYRAANIGATANLLAKECV
jgi:hypothetical protein